MNIDKQYCLRVERIPESKHYTAGDERDGDDGRTALKREGALTIMKDVSSQSRWGRSIAE